MSTGKLNCWPGCLAIVRSTPDTQRHGVVDRILKLTEVNGVCPDGTPSWGYEGPSIEFELRPGFTLVVGGLSDSILRPIRDPGDDAVDETLVRLGKPTTEEVTAC